MEPKDGKGRCSSCGFLAKFDFGFSGPPPYIYEMPPKDRDTGEMSWIRLEKDRAIIGFPQCYVKADDIWAKFRAVQQRKGQHNYLAFQQFLDEDRQCIKWRPYTPGFSPQEHLDEVRMLELELKRQQFEQQMADDQKAFLLKIDTAQKEHMRELDKGNKRVQLILGIVLGGIAVVEIIVGVLQVVYPTGFPWLQNLLGIIPPSSPLPIPPIHK